MWHSFPNSFSDILYFMIVIIFFAVFHLGNKIIKYNTIESKDEGGKSIKPKNKALLRDIILESFIIVIITIAVAILILLT